MTGHDHQDPARVRSRCCACGAYGRPKAPLVEEVDAITGEVNHRCFPCFGEGRGATSALWFTTADHACPAGEARAAVGLAARIREGLGMKT